MDVYIHINSSIKIAPDGVYALSGAVFYFWLSSSIAMAGVDTGVFSWTIITPFVRFSAILQALL